MAFDLTSVDWSARTTRQLGKAVDVTRLQAAWNEIAALSAAAGRSFVTEDWSATEERSAFPSLDDGALNRFEDLFRAIRSNFLAVESGLAQKLDSSAAASTYQVQGDYATNAALTAGLATKQATGDYATNTALTTGLSRKQDTGDYATRSELRTEQEVINLITTHAPRQDISAFQSAAQVRTIVEGYAYQTAANVRSIIDNDYDYLTADEVQGRIDSAGLTDDMGEPVDLGLYLTRNDAQSTYLSITNAQSTYLQIANAFTQAAADGLYVRTDNFPTTIGTTSDVLSLVGSQINVQIGAAASTLHAYILSTVQAATLLPSTDSQNIGSDLNRYVHGYFGDLHSTRINDQTWADFIAANAPPSDSVNLTSVGTNILFTTKDMYDIGQSGTVSAGTGKASSLDFTSPGAGHRPDHVYGKYGKFQVIEGMPWSDNSWRIAFEGTRMQFAGIGLNTHMTINWANTLHEAAPWLTQATADGRYLQSIPTAYSTTVDLQNSFDSRYLQSVPAALSGITSIGAAGDEITIPANVTFTGTVLGDRVGSGGGGISDWTGLPSRVNRNLIPDAVTWSLGDQDEYWNEVHGTNFYGLSIQQRNAATNLTIGRTGAHDIVLQGRTLNVDDLTNIEGDLTPTGTHGLGSATAKWSTAHIGWGHFDNLSATSVRTNLVPQAANQALGSNTTSWGSAHIGTVNANAINATSITLGGESLTPGGGSVDTTNLYERNATLTPTANATYDVGVQTTGEFRDGRFSRNVYAGIFEAQLFRPEATAGSSIGANSTDNIFAEGYIQTMRVRDLSALAGGDLELNSPHLEGTPVLTANMTAENTPNIGTPTDALGTVYAGALNSDTVQVRTSSSNATVGVSGTPFPQAHITDAHIGVVKPPNATTALQIGDDAATSSIVQSTNRNHSTARTNMHLAGFQWHGVMEPTPSEGTGGWFELGKLTDGDVANLPVRTGFFRKLAILPDNNRLMFPGDIDSDASYPPGTLLVTHIRSSINRSPGNLGYPEHLLEIGNDNPITDDATDRRQKWVGWWNQEQKGIRFGAASTAAQLQGVETGLQISGVVQMGSTGVTTTIDLNRDNVTYTNVPTEWTQTGGGGTTFNIGSIGDTAIQSGSTSTDVTLGGANNQNINFADSVTVTGSLDLGSTGNGWRRVYTPSLRAGGSNDLAIGGAQTGNISMGQSTTTTTITASALTLTAPTTVGGHLTPSSGGSYNIGGATNGYWDNSYITNSFTRSIQSGGANVDLDIGESTQNVLISAPLRVKTSIQGESSSHDLVIGGSNTQGVDFQSDVDFTGVTVTGITGGGFTGGTVANATTFSSAVTFASNITGAGDANFRIDGGGSNRDLQLGVFNTDNVSIGNTSGNVSIPTELHNRNFQAGRSVLDMNLGGSRTREIVVHSNFRPDDNESLGTSSKPWHDIVGRHIVSGSNTQDLTLGGNDNQKVVVDDTLQVTAANTLEVNTIISHGTDENLTVETTGTGKLKIEADVAGPDSGTIEIDHTNIRQTNRMIKIWEHIGAHPVGELSTPYTVDGETKTVAEMQTLFGDAQACTIKIGALQAGSTNKYFWSSETYFFDNDGLGGHFAGIADREVPFRSVGTDGVSATPVTIGNLNYVWDFINQTFTTQGGGAVLGAGNRLEIWIRI